MIFLSFFFPQNILIMTTLKKEILDYSGKTKLSFTDFICNLIDLYGSSDEVIPSKPYISDQKTHKYLYEEKLEQLLSDLLTEDGKTMAYYVNNTHEARDKLAWHYDTVDGIGYITAV